MDLHVFTILKPPSHFPFHPICYNWQTNINTLLLLKVYTSYHFQFLYCTILWVFPKWVTLQDSFTAFKKPCAPCIHPSFCELLAIIDLFTVYVVLPLQQCRIVWVTQCIAFHNDFFHLITCMRDSSTFHGLVAYFFLLLNSISSLLYEYNIVYPFTTERPLGYIFWLFWLIWIKLL